MLDNSYETVSLPAEDVKLVRTIRSNGRIAIVSNTGTIPASVLRAYDLLREAGVCVVVLASNGDELLPGS